MQQDSRGYLPRVWPKGCVAGHGPLRRRHLDAVQFGFSGSRRDGLSGSQGNCCRRAAAFSSSSTAKRGIASFPVGAPDRPLGGRRTESHVLDFVDPLGPGGDGAAVSWQARLDDAGRMADRTGVLPMHCRLNTGRADWESSRHRSLHARPS
jgi:hypothetical protein